MFLQMELFLISKEIEIMRKCKVNLLIHNMHSIFLRWEVNVSTVKCGLAVVSEVTKDFQIRTSCVLKRTSCPRNLSRSNLLSV